MPLNKLNRRQIIIGSAALLLPVPALALSEQQALRYVENVITDVMGVINSSKSDAQILSDFERVFTSYADINNISQRVLGVPWRGLSAQKRRAFVAAFGHYLSQKYGRQFQSYRGATITVTRAVDGGRAGFLVYSSVKRQNRSPFSLDWQVSDGGGSIKLVNMILEGINIVSTEREDIRARLARNRGDVDRLIADLRG